MAASDGSGIGEAIPAVERHPHAGRLRMADSTDQITMP
jgi:hypothetical protein